MSVSSTSRNTDINLRYDRLVAEYSKLKEQAKVLRTGVIDEKGKNKELASQLRSKEATIHRLKSENESLQFRNDQVTKRVELLQDELDKNTKVLKHKNGKDKSGDKSIIDALNKKILVMEEELLNRMLHIEELGRKVNELEVSQESFTHGEMRDLINKCEERLLLPNIKQTCMNHMANRSAPVEVIHEESSDADQSLPYVETNATPPPFPEGLGLCFESAKGVAHDLSNFCHLLSQRCELYPFDRTMEALPKPFVKMVEALVSYKEVIDAVIATFEKEEEDYLPAVAAGFDKFRAIYSVEDIKGYLKFILEQENDSTWCTWHKENGKWNQSLVNLFQVAASFSGEAMSDQRGIMALVTLLCSACKDVSESFAAKMAIESRSPMITKRLACVNEALSSCSSRLYASAAKLSARAYSLMDKESEEEEPSDPVPASAKVIMEPVCVAKADAAVQVEEPPSEVQTESVPSLEQEELERIKDKVRRLEDEREKNLVDLALLRHKVQNLGGAKDGETSSDAHATKVAMSRIRELMNECEKAERHALYYKKEMEMALRSAKIYRAEKAATAASMDDMASSNRKLTDELQCVRKSYDTQLSSMSEMIADLNARLEETKERSAAEKKELPPTRGGLMSLFGKH